MLLLLWVAPWRERFLGASIIWALLVLAVTETLSAWHALNPQGLAVAWALICVGLAARIALTKPAWPRIPPIDIPVAVMILMAGGTLVATAVIAYCAAPNTWDSLTTHLARVAYWQQNESTAMFPTYLLKRLNYPPWSQYAMAQFYILGGGDRWVSFVQWFSFAGCMVGSSLIAARLGGNPRVQALAAVLAATIPMGILQSTGTQNDCVVAFWLVCFVYYALRLMKEGQWRWALAAGASLGLAWLIKGTGYIFAAPFLVWVAAAGIKNHGRKFIGLLGLVLLTAVLLNATYYMRNLALSGKLIPSSETGEIIGRKFDVNVMAAKLVLNASFHALGPWERPNHIIEHNLDMVLHALKIDQDDERIFFQKEKFSIHSVLHEDFAGNPIHALLFIICLVALLWQGRGASKDAGPLAACALGGFLIFSFMLVWSPYHSRNHLPVFVLAAPFIAVVLGSFLQARGIMAMALFLAVTSLPWVLLNKTRPLIGSRSVVKMPRQDQYFQNMPRPADLQQEYNNAVHQVGQLQCSDVGIAMEDKGDYSFEYPLWVLLKQRPGVRIENVLVHNESARIPYPRGPFNPCALIVMEEAALGLRVRVPDTAYKALWQSPQIDGFSISVFTPAP